MADRLTPEQRRKNMQHIHNKDSEIEIIFRKEFWHGYDWANWKFAIKSNCEFWINKIEKNIMRDKEVNRSLESDGWQVLRFWGKDIKKNLSECADTIERSVKERRKCLIKR